MSHSEDSMLPTVLRIDSRGTDGSLALYFLSFWQVDGESTKKNYCSDPVCRFWLFPYSRKLQAADYDMIKHLELG
uniref:Uncharacterized protein n=1 Tax=Physcomitrium patens TaxID=3218 RepID=A0A2K1JC85_PHYPA|nr:hypothetical protein PHYPA_019417 [Physcomitrium patens]